MSLTLSELPRQICGHENRKGDILERCDFLGGAFIVSDHTEGSALPGRGAYRRPTTRQQDEAVLHFGRFDDISGRLGSDCRAFAGFCAGPVDRSRMV